MISHGNDSNSGVQTSATSYAWNHIIDLPGSILVVGFAIRPTPVIVNTLTAGGVAMTKIRNDDNGNRHSELWYLLNAPLGLISIAVTLSGGTPTNSDGHAVNLPSGLALDSHNGANNAGSATPSVNVTTVARNAWIVDMLCAGQDDNVATPNSPQILSSKVANTGAHTGAMSYQGGIYTPAATAEGYTITSNNWALSAASFSPIVGLPNNYLAMNGANGISVSEKIR